jgi:hypothetical protein
VPQASVVGASTRCRPSLRFVVVCEVVEFDFFSLHLVRALKKKTLLRAF